VPGSVRFQELGNVRDQRIVRVGVCEKGTNAEQNLADGEGRTPLVLEDVKTNAPIGVDVTVIDARGEVHLGGFKGVVSGEMDV